MGASATNVGGTSKPTATMKSVEGWGGTGGGGWKGGEKVSNLVSTCMLISKRERETDGQTDRETEGQRQRQTETHTERQRQAETERDRERERATDREKQRDTERQKGT